MHSITVANKSFVIALRVVLLVLLGEECEVVKNLRICDNNNNNNKKNMKTAKTRILEGRNEYCSSLCFVFSFGGICVVFVFSAGFLIGTCAVELTRYYNPLS